MKTILTASILSLFIILGCKDDDGPPQPTIEIEDLLGNWESVDSNVTRDSSGKWVYYNDELFFGKDTFVYGRNLPNYLIRNRDFFYNYSLFSCDSMTLDFISYLKIFTPQYRKKVILSEDKDSLYIKGINQVYPGNTFNKFIRIESK